MHLITNQHQEGELKSKVVHCHHLHVQLCILSMCTIKSSSPSSFFPQICLGSPSSPTLSVASSDSRFADPPELQTFNWGDFFEKITRFLIFDLKAWPSPFSPFILMQLAFSEEKCAIMFHFVIFNSQTGETKY